MPYEMNERNFLSDLTSAAGVAAGQASMVLQNRIEDDKVKQADRAMIGLMPSDDASLSGKRTNMLIATQDEAAEAAARLQERAKTFDGTDDEWTELVAANRRDVQQSIYERYPDLEKDPESMKAITNVFMEQQPAIAGARINTKLAMEHDDRYRNFNSMAVNQIMDKQGEDYDKTMSDLRQVGKSLQLTESEVDTAFASMALKEAKEGNTYYIEQLKGQKDKYGVSLFDKLPELQAGLKEGHNIKRINDRELIASHKMDIKEKYLSGKMSKQEVMDEFHNMNTMYQGTYMTVEQEVSFFATMDKAKRKQAEETGKIDISSDVAGLKFADLDPDTQQKNIQNNLEAIDTEYAIAVGNGTLTEEEAYARARAEKTKVREWAAQRGVYDENITKRVQGISQFSLEALTDNPDAVKEIEEVAQDFLNTPEGARGAVYKSKDFIFMNNLLANRDSKMGWGQALDMAQRQRDGIPLVGKERDKAEKKADSIAADIADGNSAIPWDNMPDGAKGAILRDIKGNYLSYLSAGATEDSAKELVTNYANTKFKTVSNGDFFGGETLIRGGADVLSQTNRINAQDLGKYTSSFIDLHLEEIEDRLGHSVEPDEIMIDYDAANNTFKLQDTGSGINVGVAMDASELFTDEVWINGLDDEGLVEYGISPYNSAEAFRANMNHKPLPDSLAQEVDDEISVKTAQPKPKNASPFTRAASGEPVSKMSTTDIESVQSSLGLKADGKWKLKDQVAMDVQYGKQGGTVLDTDVKDIFVEHESGHAGYDAVFNGKRNKPMQNELGGRKPSELSIGDILELQENARNNGARSTAIGQYQIIHSTLKGAVKKLGIPEDSKFTPELQDSIAKNYLLYSKRSAIKSYLDSGDATLLPAAQKALSKEFASFANPETGASYYKGDGLNKATVSADDSATFLKLLYTRHYQ